MNRKQKFDLANAILRDKTLSPATRIVGWYLADHMNLRRGGVAWPSYARIAGELGIARFTVIRAVKSLSHYFQISRRPGRFANEYRPQVTNCPHAAVLGHKLLPVRSQNVTAKVTKTILHPSIDPLNDPLKRPPKRKRLPVEDAEQYIVETERLAAAGDADALKVERPLIERLAGESDLNDGQRRRAVTLLALIDAKP